VNVRQIGFLVSKVHRLSGRIFSRMLKEHEIEINPAQGRIMFVLWNDDGLPIVELARRTGLGKSTLTSMLDRLEAAGYLTRERSADDRRVQIVKRTDKDRAMQQTYERVSQQMSRVYCAGFADEELDRLESDLQRILNNLTAYEGEVP
jgi:DNA-binding MarR family transcriptional regulator